MAVLNRPIRTGGARAGPAWLCALALGLGGVPAAAQSDTLEYAVKAAYLYKFTPFVDWPATAFAGPSSPFYVCILGADPFGSTLDQALDGHSVGEHPIKVRRIQSPDQAGECHILYVGAARSRTVDATLAKLRGAPVLTVSEQGGAGEIVQFVIKDGHVRFTIDAAAAAANHVTISAKLLSLAAATTGDGGRP